MDAQWLIGVIIAAVGLVGGIIARDRYVLSMINREDEATRRSIREEADKLHDRVNRVRDEYVRRVDLEGHIGRLDSSMHQLSNEMRQNAQATNTRLDAVLSHLANIKKDA